MLGLRCLFIPELPEKIEGWAKPSDFFPREHH